MRRRAPVHLNDDVTRAYRFRRQRLNRTRATARSSRPLLLALMMPVLVAGLAVASGLFAASGSYYVGVATGLESPQEAIAARGGGARIYDRNGVLLYQFLDDQTGLQQPVSLDQMSPWVPKATVATEDASFYTNPGVNVFGIARAAAENLKPGPEFMQGSGGSSITQQLVKQIYFSPDERTQRSLSRKMREAAMAIALTQKYSKDQILNWYLNVIPYGNNFTGIEQAAEGYFGVHAADLTLGQASLLAGLPQSPARYDPFTHMPDALARQHEVLDLMAEHGLISQQLADWAKFERIELHPQSQDLLAPHFVQYVADYIKATLGENALYHGDLSVVTTLDLNLNHKVDQILDGTISQYESATNAHNGAAVIIDPPTGQILAMVGSRDYNRTDIDGRVNAALALRSPGSTLKPFTYATAFEQGWGPDWPIVDTPITWYDTNGTPFSPINPDKRFHGIIPARIALGNSFNVPAFKTILWAGVDNVIATAKAAGITTLDGHDLGPALTLGGSDVKLLDLTYGYSMFANGGTQAGVPTTLSLPPGNRQLDPVPVLWVTDGLGRVVMNNATPRTVHVMDPEYAYMITDILSADANRQITYGAGSLLNIPGWRVAAKTGTSQPFPGSTDEGDTWTVGYTPDLTVGVWVGNSNYAPMRGIFSTTIAGRAWHDIMVAALAGKQPVDFQKPDGLVQATVCVPSGIVRQPGMNCPSVTGTFAAKALAQQSDKWWGGQELPAPLSAAQRAASVPAGITGWKRYLAEEYLRSYGGAPPPRPAPATPSPAAPPIAGTAPAAAVPSPRTPSPQPAPRPGRGRR